MTSIVCLIVASVTIQHYQPPIAIGVAMVAGIIAARLIPRRSRYTPASVRRSRIADWERKTGQKYDAKKYELDHDVPFSRGGSSTSDNLRVRTRKYNRSKGAKRPWWYWF